MTLSTRGPRFVAEVSSNHNRDKQRCLAFVDKAADIGCFAVKFQLFKISQLFTPEVLKARPEIQNRAAWELPLDYLPDIARRCRQRGIAFGCTPFYLAAVDALSPFVDFYKVASYELLWHELLTACARTGKPVVLSTGMADLDEIRASCQTMEQAGCTDLTLLHCVSGYPAPVTECNLGAIQAMRKTFDYDVGWSDHSVDAGVLYRAIHRWDARIVEFHFDIDGHGEEYRMGHCWLPDQIGEVIDTVRHGMQADGPGDKKPMPAESKERRWRADPSDGLRPRRSER